MEAMTPIGNGIFHHVTHIGSQFDHGEILHVARPNISF